MSVGAFFDKLIFIAIGIGMIYLSKKQKEKLGEKKAKFMMIGGIVLIIIAISLALF